MPQLRVHKSVAVIHSHSSPNSKHVMKHYLIKTFFLPVEIRFIFFSCSENSARKKKWKTKNYFSFEEAVSKVPVTKVLLYNLRLNRRLIQMNKDINNKYSFRSQSVLQCHRISDEPIYCIIVTFVSFVNLYSFMSL